MTEPLLPVPEAPALTLTPSDGSPPAVVIADLHLGLDASGERPLGPPEGSAPMLAERLLRLAKQVRVQRLVVAGDIKHPIVGVPRFLRPVLFDFFGTLLEQGLAVEVVLGNHDVGLVPHLPREVLVHPATGAVFGDVGIFHGHRWPSRSVLSARHLVVGHLHPGFLLAPTPDAPLGKRRCWVRVELPPPKRTRRRRRHVIRARDLVVLPAFHPLAGTEALNRERPKRSRSFLYGRFLSLGAPRAYLLDGTDLGVLTVPGPRARAPAARGAPRAP